MTFNAYITQAKKIITLAIPIVITEAGSQLTHVADTLMVGNISPIYIAASSLASYIYIIPLLFAIGMSMSITPITGNANGKKDMNECKKIFSNAMFMQIISAILLTLIILMLGNILPFIDKDVLKVNYAQSYFNYLALSTFPLVILFGIKQYIDAFGYTIYGMLAIIFGNVINVFLNWVFIYGKFGFTAMNLDGAGLATLISRCIALILLIVMVLSVTRLKSVVSLPRIKHIAKKYIKDFLKFGVHIGLQQSIEIAAFSTIVIFAGWLGTTAAASYQITINICGMSYLSSLGISAAATILISNYKGAKEIKGLIQGSKVILALTLIFTFICTVLIVMLRTILPPLFVNDANVIATTSMLLLMLGLVQIADGLNVTFSGILRGVLDTKIPLLINTASFWFFMIPTAYILAFPLNMKIFGIMTAVISAIILDAIAMSLRYRWTIKKQLIKLTYIDLG